MTVGERLKLYLVENKIQQNEIAGNISLSTDKLCQSLNGNRKLSVDEFEEIITFLGISAEQIIKSTKQAS